MSSVEVTSSPEEESHSPGSSVSSRLQEQYDELLRYAVVTPQFDPRSFPPHTDKMRRSPLEQVDVMAKETDVLAEKRSEESMKSLDVNGRWKYACGRVFMFARSYLYWRDASHNTINYCIGGMHLTMH